MEKLAVCMYLAAGNDLETYIAKNLMEAYGATLQSGNVEVYVFMDRNGEYCGDKTDPKTKQVTKGLDTFLIEQGNNPWYDAKTKTISKTACYLKIYYDATAKKNVLQVVSHLKKVDSASPDTLTKFMNWAKAQSDAGSNPATNYLLLMADHGGGVEESFTDKDAENGMSPYSVAKAIQDSNLGKVDIMLDDACLMANADGLSALSGCAQYMIASEDLIGGYGSVYTEMLTGLDKMAPAQYANVKGIADYLIDVNETYRKTDGVMTLSEIKLDDTVKDAMIAFGKASNTFTENDWVKLAHAFANYGYIYAESSEYAYVDLLSVLNDDELKTDVSAALQSALTKFINAVKDAVPKKLEKTHFLGTGLTVFSPIRTSEMNALNLFQQMALTPVGNDTSWTAFLMSLYDWAKKEELTCLLPAKDVLSNSLRSTNVYGMNPNGTEEKPVVTNAQAMNLGDIGNNSGMTYDHLHYLNLTKTQYFFFGYTPDKDNAVQSTLNFDFTPYDDSQPIPKGAFTVTVYAQDDSPDYTKVVASCSNEKGKAFATLNLLDLEAGEYVLTVTSETTTAEYSFQYVEYDKDKEDLVGKVNDSLDYYSETSNNTFQKAFKLSENYYGGLIVYADEKSTSHSDWYHTNYKSTTVVFTVVGGNCDIEDEPNFYVEQYKRVEDKVVKTKEAVEGKFKTDGEKKYWEYVVEGFTSDDNLLKISTDDSENIYYYNITVKDVRYPSDKESSSEIQYTATIESEESTYETLYWRAEDQSEKNQLQLSADKFKMNLNCLVRTYTARVYNNSTELDWRVRNANNVDETKAKNPTWVNGDTLSAKVDAEEDPRDVTATNDGVADILLARSNGQWEDGYWAKHVGFINGWQGTQEKVALTGKTMISDIFHGGGTDDAILILTDNRNGDALFADDIYSAFPQESKSKDRISCISDIYAGAGDDIIDLTSQRDAYSAINDTKLQIHGGDGNDTIWAGQNGQYILFGDAGNDRLVGSTKNDVLIGGLGSDSMNGGGGEDIFCFCENWGSDTVEQVLGGKVILWFESTDEGYWDPTYMTYISGNNSVKVSGVGNSNVEIRYGDKDKAYAADYDSLKELNCFDGSSSTTIYTELA